MDALKRKIYHITHLNNLEGICSDKGIWSDAKRLELGLECKIVGMSDIKWRRLREREVKCHPGTMVGQYVPFNFCPRSVMLYILHKGNHPNISYRGGQAPILHLQVDLDEAVNWANRHDVKWAFSDINAGTEYAQFCSDIEGIDDVIDWSAVEATDWRNTAVQEYKQAELLMYEFVPLKLVEKIGVYNKKIREHVLQLLGNDRTPEVSVESEWYYCSP